MPNTDPQQVVDKINATIPVHSMWDGFWVHHWYNGNLTVSCSFDRIYYRDFDVFFRRVSFFNLPSEWRDTNMNGDNFFRLVESSEFQKHYPDEKVSGSYYLAFDLGFHNYAQNEYTPFTSFVVCDDIAIDKPAPGEGSYTGYKDPCEEQGLMFPSPLNRVKEFRKLQWVKIT